MQEILKHVEITDMKNISLTSKTGYELTKEYFESKTMLKFSRPFTISELKIASKISRKHSDIFVDLGLDHKNDVIFNQLNYLKIEPTIVSFGFNNYVPNSDLYKVKETIWRIKSKNKTVRKVCIKFLCNDIESEDNIAEIKDSGISTEDITAINVFIPTTEIEELEGDILEPILQNFQNLESIQFNNNFFQCPRIVSPKFNMKFPHLKEVSFDMELQLDTNLIEILSGIQTINVNNYRNPMFLEKLLDANKKTLKTLDLEITYQYPIDDGRRLVIPGQLENLFITDADRQNNFESLIINQTKLKSLHLNNVHLNEAFLKAMETNCPSKLRIIDCIKEDLQPQIPTLEMVKNLEISRKDSIQFLPKTKNIESLEIIWNTYNIEKFEGFQMLNGLKFEHLKILNVESFNTDLLEQFSSIQLILPRLESLSSHFNLKLLETYKTIQNLKVFGVNLDNIKLICTAQPSLRNLEVILEGRDLFNILEFLVIQPNYEFIKIVSKKCLKSSGKTISDILNRKNFKMIKEFGCYEGDEIGIIFVELDKKENFCMIYEMDYQMALHLNQPTNHEME